MDGRRCSFLLLALSLGVCGCVPGQFKNNVPDNKPPVADEVETSRNPFVDPPKREPGIELAMAQLHEDKATSLKDNPEQQFKQLDEARRMYQEILVYDAKNIKAHRGLTRVYIAQRDFARANSTMQKATELQPKNAQLYADWAVIHSKQNDFPGAIAKLNKAREIDPENQEFMKALGVNMVFAGQVQQGIDMLSRARGQAAAHYYVARIYMRTNQPDQAMRHAQMALESNPNFNDARTLLTELNRQSPPRNVPPANVGLQFVSDETP